jgi:DNA-binding transcriptional LysR family regulator
VPVQFCGVDLEGVRTFVACADAGQFQEAAARLSVTQQGVSKRMAALEKDLGVRLFTRSARGVQLTVDGQAFLPHARELLRVAARADAAVRPGGRALRIDVLSRRIAPAVLVEQFYRTHPGVELDVVTLDADVRAAIAAVEAGTVDATFHAVTTAPQYLPAAIRTARAIDDPHQLLVGPRHAFASARAVTPAQLAGHRIWMPGMARGTEWAAYYGELAAAFGLTIDVAGPAFGNEALMAEIAGSAQLATLVGQGSRYLWPDRYDLRRIPLHDPVPVYPLSLIWRADNRHPALPKLRRYLASRRQSSGGCDVWLPTWAAHTRPEIQAPGRARATKTHS